MATQSIITAKSRMEATENHLKIWLFLEDSSHITPTELDIQSRLRILKVKIMYQDLNIMNLWKKKLFCKFDRTEKRKNEWFTPSQSHEDTEKYQCVPEKCHWKIHWLIVNRKISLFELHAIIEHENKNVIIKAANSSKVFF